MRGARHARNALASGATLVGSTRRPRGAVARQLWVPGSRATANESAPFLTVISSMSASLSGQSSLLRNWTGRCARRSMLNAFTRKICGPSVVLT